jgi:hypothetical protein
MVTLEWGVLNFENALEWYLGISLVETGRLFALWVFFT